MQFISKFCFKNVVLLFTLLRGYDTFHILSASLYHLRLHIKTVLISCHILFCHIFIYFSQVHTNYDRQNCMIINPKLVFITIYILTRTKHNTTNLFLSPDHRTAFRSPATITLPLRPLLLLLIHQPYIHNYRDFFSCYKCKLQSHSEQNRCVFIHKDIRTQYNGIECIQNVQVYLLFIMFNGPCINIINNNNKLNVSANNR